jgi:hypothetical protein
MIAYLKLRVKEAKYRFEALEYNFIRGKGDPLETKILTAKLAENLAFWEFLLRIIEPLQKKKGKK